MRFQSHPSGALWSQEDIVVEGYQDHRYCAVSILDANGRVLLGRGTARRDPYDKHNPEIAQQLALGRALENAARKVLKKANGMVLHAEHVQASKRFRRDEVASWDAVVSTVYGLVEAMDARIQRG